MSKEMSKRYEAAWNQLFYEEPEWRQGLIIEEPHGRHAGKLASLAARLAEAGKLTELERSHPKPITLEMPPTGVI